MSILAQQGGTLLRRMRPADLSRFWQTRQDPSLARYQGWARMGGAQARGFIAHMTNAAIFAPGEWSQITIADRDAPQRPLGDIGLCLSADSTEVELGITLARDAQGKGHAQRALAAACQLVWTRSPALRVVGVADTRNHASVRLMQRAGFAPHGTIATIFQGRPCCETSLVHRRPTLPNGRRVPMI